MNQAEIKRRQTEAFANILSLVTIYVLGRLLGNTGITYVAVAAEVCAFFCIAIDGSVSDALGRLLRGRKNKGQYKNMARMRAGSMIFQMIQGLAGSLALLLFAQRIGEKIFRIRYCGLIIMAFSPLVLLRTAASVLSGYFQGEGSELPRAFAGIFRQVFLFGFGLLFGNILQKYGEKVSGLLQQEDFVPMYSGLGIALAAILAELLVVFLLLFLYKISRRSGKRDRQEGYATESYWDCIRYLCAGRWPQFIMSLLVCLPLALGVLLTGKADAADPQAIAEYGLYAGKYLVFCGVFVSLISICVLPVTGKIFLHFRRNENRFARTAFQCGVHICMVYGIFFSVYVAFMGARIAGLLCPDNVELMAKMLAGGSSVIAFVSLSLYFARLLQAAGKKYIMLGAVGGSVVIYVITAMVMSRAGVLALVYGGMTASFVLCLIFGIFSYQHMWVQADWLGALLVPLGAGVPAGLVCLLTDILFASLLGDLPTLLIALVLSGAVYCGTLLLLRNIKEHELESIYGGRFLGMLGQKLRIY